MLAVKVAVIVSVVAAVAFAVIFAVTFAAGVEREFAVDHVAAVALEVALKFAGMLAVISAVTLVVLFSADASATRKIRNATGTSFEDATLTKSRFMAAILNNCDFTDAKLYQTDWTHAHFRCCKFSGYLDNQAIRELCVSRIGANEKFSSMDLSGLNLIGVNLYGANLAAANLSQTNLSQANLTNTDLCNVQAIKTDFTNADLSGANLADANLNQSNLSQANLTNTDLCDVQAIKTDFTNADLSGACIENWAITPETIFTDVICSHIFLDFAKSERNPASGSLEQGDFAKLVTQSTKSLDFFFRNGIDPQAFDFAFKKLRDEYPEMELSIKAIEDLGDGDKQIRLNTVSNAPKAEMHAQFTQDYEEMHQELEASRNKVWELQQKLDRIDLENKLERFELEKQLAVAIAKLEERPTSKDLQNLLYHQSSQLGKQRLLNAPNSTFIDTMTDKPNQINVSSSSNVALNTGDNNQGVIGNISGTVTNTIQQLRETNQPEAPQLSDLLEQLQKTVESSSELGESDKEKALEYLNQIGNMSAKDPSQKKGMLPILLDAFTGVISKAASLIEPVKKIADAILSIWQA
ncbi:pentapeptide repeat-containing protein [Pseudanabaena sp. Chao 1811]|uniref:pentapeptide repeat-containing protein n=1 Tax=Pseudanabaena sp. Chao 1811 TaxID=2963092 RepID=UPI0022F405BC|nr:pentapeptide repeat-containing protein [Pseudanabaena sp. Chao 1811]